MRVYLGDAGVEQPEPDAPLGKDPVQPRLRPRARRLGRHAHQREQLPPVALWQVFVDAQRVCG